MSHVPSRSRSGVRIAGDDYQHLVTWNEVLNALRPDRGVERITVEARDAGNVDDIVVEYRSTRPTYTQVKHTVDGQTPVNTEWLITPTRRGSRSLLQRFYDSWRQLANGSTTPDLQVLTDRELDPRDELVKVIDRRTELLVPDIAASGLAQARAEWVDHLEISDGELLRFLADLRFRTGRPLAAELQRAESLMWGLGLNTGQQAIDSGVALVRDWIQDRERALDAEELQRRVDDRVGRRADPGGLLIVEAVDDDPHSEDADARVRFVELYDGDDPFTRRALHNPADWEQRVGPGFEAAASDLRSMGKHRVVVRGALRLPMWFGVGAALRHVRGFTVAAVQHDDLWASDTAADDHPDLEVRREPLDGGRELAVAVGVATDPTAGVRRFIEDARLPVAELAVVLPVAGPGPESVPDGPTAAAMAIAVRDTVRGLLEAVPTETIHLFLATPGGLALLLGHRWNAMRPTQLYEDLGPGQGYQAALMVTA